MAEQSVLHLSDLHLRGDANAEENRHTEIIVNWIVANRPASTVVVTGDVTEDGAEDEDTNLYTAAMVLSDADDLIESIEGNDLLMFGHEHRPNSWRDEGGSKAVLAAGKVTSQRSGAPSGGRALCIVEAKLGAGPIGWTDHWIDPV